jgi:hypothetical protein
MMFFDRTTTIAYIVGNPFSCILYEEAAVWRLSHFQQSVDLNDSQQPQNNENEGNNEQRVDNVASARKAREDIRAEVSEQP